jgi:C-terminal processing protease CtpA/Prc
MILAGIIYFSFNNENKTYTTETKKEEGKTSSDNIQSEFTKFKVVYSIKTTSVWITDFIYARSIAEAGLRLRANPKVVRIGNISPIP